MRFHLVQLNLQPLDFRGLVFLKLCVGIDHITHLLLVLLLKGLNERALTGLLLLLVHVAAFGQLLESHLELALRIDEVTFVRILLLLKELRFSLP